jgi:hypothetical protein
MHVSLYLLKLFRRGGLARRYVYWGRGGLEIYHGGMEIVDVGGLLLDQSWHNTAEKCEQEVGQNKTS